MKLFLRGATLFAAAALGFAFSVHAQAPDQFPEVQIDNSSLPPFVPRSIDKTRKTVVVLFSGDSVADVQKRAGRALSQSERDSIKAARAADHALAKPEIERRGGTVLGTLHGALNGIKVSIPNNRMHELHTIPGVVSVKPVGIYEPSNAVSIPLIGAPQVWQGAAHIQGQGVKIAIIDTGIDYTHANFGGPGTVAAFNTANATSTLPANPALFGPAAPKVKGGWDFVGDAYNAGGSGAALVPHPDPNPLDCGGHGSHVAGTAAGFGVTSAGTTFAGPYTAAAYTPGAFAIGPGVAPKADLYAYRVFGCSGSTDVVADAIDMAVADGMDVISMSLGSNFGAADNSESAAIASATAAGILVVAASGNAGPVPYITSAPASSPGAISVAATDALAGVPTATLALTGGSSITVQNSNGGVFANGSNWPIVVLRNGDGTVSLGCNEAEYVDAIITGKLVVTLRGVCARVFRAGAGQKHGAAAVAMINTSAGYPVYEGPIPGGDPATNPFAPVTIPFFGVLASDTATLTGPVGGPAPANAVATNAAIVPNTNFEIVASFSSGGPRTGDSVLRPGVTAPGVSTFSTRSGSGNSFIAMSGTSMATPHIAGVAALVHQMNPSWPVADQRAAVVQTASPSLMKDYSPRNEGAGLVQALAAVNTQAVVRSPDESVSFGYADLLADYSATRNVTVHNDGPKAVQFNIGVTPYVGSAGATLTAPPSVIVNGKGDATFPVTLNVPAASMGGTHTATGACCVFTDAGGYVQLTPSSSRLNGNVKLTVPYYFVGHTRSNLTTTAASINTSGATPVPLSNAGGVLAGTPDFYSLGLTSPPQGVTFADTRAIGVKQATSGTTPVLVFAVNTHGRFSNAAGFVEWDIYIDSTGGAGFNPNYVLVGYNGSAFTTSASAQNVLTAALIRLSDNAIVSLRLADAATDNSTALLPVTRATLGLTAANARIKYAENHFGPDGTSGSMPGIGSFNSFTPALTVAGGGAIAPGGSTSVTANVSAAEWAVTPAMGLMIVAADNAAGASQARLVPAVSPP